MLKYFIWQYTILCATKSKTLLAPQSFTYIFMTSSRSTVEPLVDDKTETTVGFLVKCWESKGNIIYFLITFFKRRNEAKSVKTLFFVTACVSFFIYMSSVVSRWTGCRWCSWVQSFLAGRWQNRNHRWFPHEILHLKGI